MLDVGEKRCKFRAVDAISVRAPVTRLACGVLVGVELGVDVDEDRFQQGLEIPDDLVDIHYCRYAKAPVFGRLTDLRVGDTNLV